MPARSRCLTAAALVLAAGLAPLLAAGPAPGREFLELRAAMHIHTTYSTGDESVRQVAARAAEGGLDVVVFTDDDLLKVEYGLPPLRRLLRVAREYRSLLSESRLEEYLAEIRQLDEEYGEQLILIDGIESAPYYRWQVDWGERLWTVHDWNRHLLAVGLGTAEAYHRLPVMGGVNVRSPDWVGALAAAWPLIGIAYGLWLGRRTHGPGLRTLVTVVSLLFLADSALEHQRAEPFSPYREEGVTPYQAYIDAVIAGGGLAFWAHPEAASTIPPESVLGGALRVQSQTGPHAHDLVETHSYTGFAALYADNITATEPGREWDRVLTGYLNGTRGRPAWGTGEIDYHLDEAGNRIDDIQTVLWARERSREGVLEALGVGRSYAVRGGERALVLEGFSLSSTRATAVSGERTDVGTEPWRITAVVGQQDGSREQVHLRLVRGQSDGTVRVVADASGLTPLRLERVETELAPGEARYYRLLARSRSSRLTTNPVFARGAGG